ncbi:MAG: hypothetical protein AB1414_09585 [bacterium]
MKVIAKPKKEEEVLASVKKDAKDEEILKSLVTKAEHCVCLVTRCASG